MLWLPAAIDVIIDVIGQVQQQIDSRNDLSGTNLPTRAKILYHWTRTSAKLRFTLSTNQQQLHSHAGVFKSLEEAKLQWQNCSQRTKTPAEQGVSAGG